MYALIALGGRHLTDMENDDRQVFTIIEYMEGIPNPTPGWPAGLVKDCSYSRCADDEILKENALHPEKSPMRVVKEFETLMSEYAMIANSDHYGKDIADMFEIAWREAINIADILAAMS